MHEEIENGDERLLKMLYVQIKEYMGNGNDEQISIGQYNKEIHEPMKRMNAGEYYTHEQVVAMWKEWTRWLKEK